MTTAQNWWGGGIIGQPAIEFLKAYFQISNRGCSQKFQNMIFFLPLFIALFLKTHFPKGIEQKSFQGEIRAIFKKILVSENLFNTIVYGAISMYIYHDFITCKQNIRIN